MLQRTALVTWAGGADSRSYSTVALAWQAGDVTVGRTDSWLIIMRQGLQGR